MFGQNISLSPNLLGLLITNLLLVSIHPAFASSISLQTRVSNESPEFVEGSRIISPQIQKAIEDYIRTLYQWGNPTFGLGLSIVQLDDEGNDKVLYSEGFGKADIEKEIQNTNSSQFLLGSIAKVLKLSIFFKLAKILKLV